MEKTNDEICARGTTVRWPLRLGCALTPLWIAGVLVAHSPVDRGSIAILATTRIVPCSFRGVGVRVIVSRRRAAKARDF